VRIRKALAWVAFWAGLALLFNLAVYLLIPYIEPSANRGEKALQFFGGYVIELSLSVDNLFVFLMIFSSFNVPANHQRRVLNYGIAGAVILRLAFILLGSALVSKFTWVLYIFGGMLIISGATMFIKGEGEKDYKKSRVMLVFDRSFPYTGTLEGEKFIVKRNGKRYATLLMAVLVLIELSDLIFNIDSIPAIFSFTRDPFIIFTSNVFAIVGLRSFYFVLERLSQMFRYVKYGVALILAFTGLKLYFPLLMPVIGIKESDPVAEILFSIGVIIVILLGSVFASVIIKKKKPSDHH
jgi:tellurite resistance protein TerC